MRILLGLCGVVAAVSVMNGVAETKDAVSVSIQCSQSEVKSGAEVKLVITVTSTSDHDVNLYKTPGPDGQAEDVNRIEVRDGSGNLLPRAGVQTVEIGGTLRTLPKKIRVSRKGVILKPGENLTDFTILTNLFNLSKPGIYTVTVQNGRRPEDGGSNLKLIYVKSNAITIAVLPADS